MRRFAFLALAVGVLALATTASHAAIKGDVNLDGQVDSADDMLLDQALAGSYTLAWSQRDAADVAPLGANDQIGDGIVDSADALVFDQALAGNDLDGDGLNVAAEIAGTTATNGSPFLRDTDKDGAPDHADATRGGFNANAPPATPSLAITGSTTTSLTGTVSACSNPDGLPYPSACTQEVRIVAAGASCDGAPVVAPVVPSSGSWSIGSLPSGVLYSAYARSSDGSLVACSPIQTAATAPVGTAAVVPMLTALSSTTSSNPTTVSGFGFPGQQVRVFVNGAEQDFVRTFATGNPAISPNPFVVPASGAFAVPVVLDDGINRITVSAISSGSVESGPSNEVSTKYENLIPRGTTNPLRITPAPTPDDPNSEEISAGQIFVLTKGDMPGFTAEYYLDRHLEAKENALLVIGAGAQIRVFLSTVQSPWKRKILVGGTLRTRGSATNLAKVYATSPTATTVDSWGGTELQSTSRASVLEGISIRNAGKAVAIVGTTSNRPDAEIRDSSLSHYKPAGIDIATGGQITIASTSLTSSGTVGGCDQTAIAATDTTSLTVRESYVEGNGDGVVLTDSSALIEKNDLYAGVCTQDGAAISVEGAGTISILQNDISNNSDDNGGSKWQSCIVVENASPTIDDNSISRCISAIEVFTSGGGSASPLIEDNLIDGVSQYTQGNDPNSTRIHGAVVLRDGAGGTVRRNDFANRATPTFGRGVFVLNAGSTPIEIADNVFTHLLMGVQIENASIPSGEAITVSGNSIGMIARTGVRARYSDVLISANFLRHAGFSGASNPWTSSVLLDSTTARVEGNSIQQGLYGIRIIGGSPEIVGNHIARNNAAGILVEASVAGTVIQGNRIEENTQGLPGVGIIVRHSGAGTAGTIVAIDGGNVISGNRIGIRIEGLANSATGQPVPVITGNTIHSNAWPVGAAAHNIEIVSYSTPTQTTLDVSSNWWNSTSQTTIEQGILYLSPPASGLQPIADIDFANVVTAPNTNFFVGQLSASVAGESARGVWFTPDLSASPQPVVELEFMVYDPGASVVARICPELDSTCTAANAVFSSSPQTFSAGAQQIDWNGADPSGKAVAPEAYVYKLEATKASVTQVIDSPIPDGHTGGVLVSPLATPTTYDGYRNGPIEIQYRIQPSGPIDIGYGPARAVFVVEPKDAAGRVIAGERFLTGSENFPNGLPLPAYGGSASNIPFMRWQARNALTARIVSGGTAISIVSRPMKRYVVIVAGSAPAITSDSGAIHLAAEPRLVYDTFEQVAAVSYRVDRLSDVSISLLPPNSWSDTGAPTWSFANVPANTTQLFEFRGHEVAGMVGVSADSARNLVTALEHEGAFTFRVRATDKVSTRTAETLVTVQVRH